MDREDLQQTYVPGCGILKTGGGGRGGWRILRQTQLTLLDEEFRNSSCVQTSPYSKTRVKRLEGQKTCLESIKMGFPTK
jgi:hypothetical protein